MKILDARVNIFLALYFSFFQPLGILRHGLTIILGKIKDHHTAHGRPIHQKGEVIARSLDFLSGIVLGNGPAE